MPPQPINTSNDTNLLVTSPLFHPIPENGHSNSNQPKASFISINSPCLLLRTMPSPSSRILVRFLIFVTLVIFIFLLLPLFIGKERLANLQIIPTHSTQSPDAALNIAIKNVHQDMETIERDALLDYATSRISGLLGHRNFQEFGYRLRVFKKMLESYASKSASLTEKLKDQQAAFSAKEKVDVIDVASSSDYASLHVKIAEENDPYSGAPKLLWRLERELFPWSHVQFRSLLDLRRSFRGKGIIIPTGSGHLRFAAHLIRMLKVLNCSLPIVVAYGGPKDLKPEEVNYIHKMGAEFFDVSSRVDADTLNLVGWQIKPFAILMSPFEQVIMMDADVVWLKNPEVVLSDPGYLETGAIIFHDRTLFPNDTGKPKWIKNNLPSPLSSTILSSRMFRQVSGHEQESGVLVIDKNKHFYGLLAACKMNAKKEREDVTYKEFYGDKESFWLGMEMAGESYTSLQMTPGAIGNSKISEATGEIVACGRITQFDRDGMPLWFNGGIVWDKHDEVRRNYLMRFSHFGKEGVWDFASGCVNGSVTALNPDSIGLLETFGKLWRQDVRVQLDPEVDLNTSPAIGPAPIEK